MAAEAVLYSPLGTAAEEEEA
eukprot:SAG31_NODE_43891_length_265_cov_0.626506_1_plen_20_part_01